MLHKRLSCVVAAVMAALAVGWAPVPKPKAPKPDSAEAERKKLEKAELKRLEGMWARAVLTDWVGPEPRYGRVCIFFAGRLLYLSGSKVVHRCSVTLNPRKRAMDTKEEDQLTLCAYELRGEQLVLAYYGDPKVASRRRPPGVSQREGVIVEVLTLKRRRQP
jgi:hypothetical protein